MKNLILAYEEAAENLADAFAEKYYGKDASDIFWIGEEAGGVLVINDQFWNFRDVVIALRLSVPRKVLFDWDNKKMEAALKDKDFVNLETFIKMQKVTKPGRSRSKPVK